MQAITHDSWWLSIDAMPASHLALPKNRLVGGSSRIEADSNGAVSGHATSMLTSINPNASNTSNTTNTMSREWHEFQLASQGQEVHEHKIEALGLTTLVPHPPKDLA